MSDLQSALNKMAGVGSHLFSPWEVFVDAQQSAIQQVRVCVCLYDSRQSPVALCKVVAVSIKELEPTFKNIPQHNSRRKRGKNDVTHDALGLQGSGFGGGYEPNDPLESLFPSA